MSISIEEYVKMWISKSPDINRDNACMRASSDREIKVLFFLLKMQYPHRIRDLLNNMINFDSKYVEEFLIILKSEITLPILESGLEMAQNQFDFSTVQIFLNYIDEFKAENPVEEAVVDVAGAVNDEEAGCVAKICLCGKKI